MKLIAHRGNTQGPSESENQPDYILEALNNGFNAEIDVWFVNREFWLGHDEPQYQVNLTFLRDPRLWCHAKSLGALEELLSPLHGAHCFWHQEDDYTITSHGYIWTYPNQDVCEKSVLVVKNAKKISRPPLLWPVFRIFFNVIYFAK